MRYLFIINPKAFGLQKRLQHAVDSIHGYFATNRHLAYDVYFSRFPRDAVGYIMRYLGGKSEQVRVCAVGGNGTLFDALNGVFGNKKADLAYIPFGTKHSASSIHSLHETSTNILHMIDKQVTGSSVPVDLLRCGSNCGINFCTIGLETQINKDSAFWRQRFHFMQRPAMGLSTAWNSVFSPAKHQNYQITIDGQPYHGCYTSILVANGFKPGAVELNPTPQNKPLQNDGVLDVFFSQTSHYCNYVQKDSNCLQTCTTPCTKSISHVLGKTIVLSSLEPLEISLDGEFFRDTSAQIEIVPSGVRFVSHTA